MIFKEESIMTTLNYSPTTGRGLPQALKVAQEAMQLPDVQEMLRKLSEYGLGIFMPHMHDEASGAFQPLPEGILQVESAFEVSFRTAGEIVNQRSLFLPVAWTWQAGTPAPSAVCEMVWDGGSSDSGRNADHKMKKGV